MFWANYNDLFPPSSHLKWWFRIREFPQNPLNSGLRVIVICPDMLISTNSWQTLYGKVGIDLQLGDVIYENVLFTHGVTIADSRHTVDELLRIN